MMSTLQKHLDDARRRLMYPLRSSLDDNILAPYCIDILDELLTKQQNSKEPHLIGFAPIVTVPGQVKYSLDDIAPGYGKARYLYTRNQFNDPNYQRRWVELVSMETLTEVFRGGDAVGRPPRITNIPILEFVACVYNDADAGFTLEIAPIPQETYYFDFVYDVAINRPATKASNGFGLPQFDALVAAKTAFRAIPHCRWHGLDRDGVKERKAEIKEMLAYDIGSVNGRTGLEYLFWQSNLTTYDKANDRTVGFLRGQLY